MLSIKRKGRSLNYGSDRVRYITPVQVGERIRLHVVLKDVEARPDGALMTRRCTLEVEGRSKPAMIAEVLTLTYK
jgi:acyl dehydratase